MAIVKWFGWLALACACAGVAWHAVEGWTAPLYAFGCFYAPWGLRAALCGDEHEKNNHRFWLVIVSICLLALLTGCQTAADRGAKVRAEAEAAWEKNYTSATISIHSAPSGAVVDLNGDVVGTTPFTLHLDKCWRGGWPASGHTTQILRARWLDGMMQHEFFPVQSKPPKTVLFMHPRATDYLHQPQPRLSQN